MIIDLKLVFCIFLMYSSFKACFDTQHLLNNSQRSARLPLSAVTALAALVASPRQKTATNAAWALSNLAAVSVRALRQSQIFSVKTISIRTLLLTSPLFI